MLEIIEDYVSSERALRIVDVDMSRFKDVHLQHFAAGGYLNVLKEWLKGGMAETPREIGELTATHVHMLLGTRTEVPSQAPVGESSEQVACPPRQPLCVRTACRYDGRPTRYLSLT